MMQIYIVAGIGVVLFTVLGFTWLLKKRWGRWVMFTALTALLGVFAVAFAIDSNRSAGFWQKTVDEHGEKIAYQRDVLAQLKAGKTPPTECKYKRFDAWNCYCVSGEDAQQRSTTNAKRKPAAGGLSCLDESGLESEIAAKMPYHRDYEAKVAGAKQHMWMSVGGVGFLAVLFPVAIAWSRRKRSA